MRKVVAESLVAEGADVIEPLVPNPVHPDRRALPVDRLIPLMLVLSATTGLVDAASVLGLGKVFTANMTGNIVFLGFAAAGAPGFEVIPTMVALAVFFAGALSGGRASRRFIGQPLWRFLTTAAVLESVMLAGAAAIAVAIDLVSAPDESMLMVVGLTALAMGFRNAAIRQLRVPDLTTTVLTMTITGLAADSRLANGASPNWGRRLGSIGMIFIGACLGASLFQTLGLYAPLALAGMLVLVGTLFTIRHLGVGHTLMD